MQKKNDNFLEKIVKKDYNNELEAILEKKYFNEDVGREYIQINSDTKIQSSFICLKCGMELRKEDFFEPYRSMMK